MSEIDQHPDWSEEAHEHICGLVNENETLRTALAASDARVRELGQALKDEETFASHATQAKRCESERAEAAESQLAALHKSLQDPENVLACMLRGTIAKLSWRGMCSLTGEVPNGEDVQLSEIVKLRERVRELSAENARLANNCLMISDTHAALLDGLEGLVKKWNRGTTDQDCLYDKGLYYCADEIQSLLTQTAPSVNSAAGARKVYVVTDGQYSDFRILGIFSSLAQAEQLHWVDNCSNGIDEWPLDEPPDWPVGLAPWLVSMDMGGNTQKIERRERFDKEEEGPIFHWDHAQKNLLDSVDFSVWAKDQKHAVKVANERRLQLLASGQWRALQDETTKTWRSFWGLNE